MFSPPLDAYYYLRACASPLCGGVSMRIVWWGPSAAVWACLLACHTTTNVWHTLGCLTQRGAGRGGSRDRPTPLSSAPYILLSGLNTIIAGDDMPRPSVRTFRDVIRSNTHTHTEAACRADASRSSGQRAEVAAPAAPSRPTADQSAPPSPAAAKLRHKSVCFNPGRWLACHLAAN